MSVDPELLARYLAQTVELGGADLYLDTLTGREARRLVAAARRGAPVQAQPVTAEASAAGGSPGARERVVASAATMTREEARAALGAMFAESGHGTVAPAPPSGGTATAAPSGALRVLEASARTCTRCRLAEGRTNVVFGDGSVDADVVVVGEAPGQEEDRSGLPFVGRAGRLLDVLLLSAGWPRDRVYICNVLKCRPPNNRNPLPDEIDTCTSAWLYAQIEAVSPRVVLAVGKFAVQTLCRTEESVGRMRGRIHDFDGVPLIATYHPAYLLRTPAMVRTVWQDFQLLRKVHDEQA